jgi:cholest-4-en-3-one 26-monooxygenase
MSDNHPAWDMWKRGGMFEVLEMNVFDPDLYASGDPTQNGLPNDLFTRLRDQSPCLRLPCEIPGHERSAWVLSRYEDVSAMLRDPGRFLSGGGVTMRATHTTVSGDGGKPAMITMDGDAHVRNRRLVNRGFTPAVVRSFERHFRTVAGDIVDRALQLETFDFVGEVASQFPLHAICDLLGVPEADRPALARWTNTLTTPTDPEYAPTPEEFFAAMEHMWAYGLELAEIRRRTPGTDVMSVIVAAADNDMLSEDELMGFVFTLSAAGNETTRNSASHALLALLQRPAQLAWLRDRADHIPESAIEELLRWSTPVVYIRRTAATDLEIHGQPIVAGDPVAGFVVSANFDQTEFPDPLELDLTRKPNRHLSFATGPHLCMGAHIARLELRVLFEELLQRTTKLELTGPTEYARDGYVRGVKRLGVRAS